MDKRWVLATNLNSKGRTTKLYLIESVGATSWVNDTSKTLCPCFDRKMHFVPVQYIVSVVWLLSCSMTNTIIELYTGTGMYVHVQYRCGDDIGL